MREILKKIITPINTTIEIINSFHPFLSKPRIMPIMNRIILKGKPITITKVIRRVNIVDTGIDTNL